jgi:cytochrome c peroxidase
MQKAIVSGLILSGFSGLAVSALAQNPLPDRDALHPERLLSDAQAIFQPLPAIPAATDPTSAARIDLGRHLFFESRVSVDGTVSCSHCHQPDKQAADGLPKAIGVFGKVNTRNAPSIFNASLNFKQHWRGDRESLEEQAEKSLLGPATFGNPDYAAPMGKLRAIPAYGPAFAKAFPDDKDPITPKNWAAAIAAYERTLLTPSKFDTYLGGNVQALSDAERAGLRNFIDSGCAACHDGAGIGGNAFQKFGVVVDYWKETGSKDPDKGRADVTKSDADLYVFKVPSLRNVAETAPYFHDGSVAELKRAVEIMGKTQLGADIPEIDLEAITAFLGTLTGPVPANYSEPERYPDATPAP